MFCKAKFVVLLGSILLSNCLFVPAGVIAQDSDQVLWKLLDSNGDGWLDGSELTPEVKVYDADGDGEVTKAEFLAGRKSVQVPSRANDLPSEPKIARPAAKPASKAPAKNTQNTQPILGKIEQGKPVGFFYMQKYWMATRSLENACWYFTPEGRVYQNITTGFSEKELKQHQGPKGTYQVDGQNMTITWDGQSPSTCELEFTETGFYWDTGSYIPVESFDNRAIAGEYSGGSSMTFAGSSSMIAKTLRLNADGTFQLEGAATIQTDVDENSDSDTRARAGGTSGVTGRWERDGFYLTLMPNTGETQRHLVFPFDDEDTPVYPDRLYMSGMMLKKAE